MSGTPSARCAGKVALVTGASRGLGKAIAERLAAEGARVAVSARTLEPDERVPGSLRETVDGIVARGGAAIAVQCDLARPEDRERMVAETVEQLGPIDILVNNAAVTFFLPFDGFPEKRWRLMFEVQVRAPYELAQLVVPSMRERGEGWILNISSRAAVHPEGPPFEPWHVTGGVTAYGMVKAALDRFSTALAAELSNDGVAVNSLSPWDTVATPGAGHHNLVDEALEGPEWIAEAALLLCSSPPRELTGLVAYSQQLLAAHNIRPAALNRSD